MNDRIGSLLDRINTFSTFFENKIMAFHRDREVQGMSKLQFSILNTLYCNRRMKVSDLADRMHLSMPNCSRYLNWLIRDGYVLKEQDAQDKRVYYVTPSSRGIELVDQVLLETNKSARAMLSQMDNKSIDDLIAAMDLIEDSFTRMT